MGVLRSVRFQCVWEFDLKNRIIYIFYTKCDDLEMHKVWFPQNLPDWFYCLYAEMSLCGNRQWVLHDIEYRLHRVIKNSLRTWWIKYRSQVHRDFFIPLYFLSFSAMYCHSLPLFQLSHPTGFSNLTNAILQLCNLILWTAYSSMCTVFRHV